MWIRIAAVSVMCLGLAAISASVNTASPSAANGPVLVVAAHPDDEALGMAGVIQAALDAGRTVYVAVVTNGDTAQSGSYTGYCGAAPGTGSSTARYGLTRDGETLAGMGLLGLTYSTTVGSSRIFFLGYPNGSLATIATATTPWTGDPSGLHHTYAEDSDGNVATCTGDLAYLVSGVHSPFTGAALAADFDRLLGATNPDDIYTHVSFDGHPDHQEVYRQLVAAVNRAGTSVTVHSTLIHPDGTGSCMAFSAALWPNPPEADNDPFARFTPTLDVTAPPVPACSAPPTGYSWGPQGAPNETALVPVSMQATTEAQNLKWQVISRYASQIDCVRRADGTYHPSCGYMRAFVKLHEFFWTESLPSIPPPPAGPYDSFVAESGCEASMVSADELRATIAGGANDRDSAYGVKDVGGASGLSGRVYVRTLLRLEPGQTLGANLTVFQVRDTSGALVYELYLGADRSLRLYSPAGGLRSSSLNTSTGVLVPNDGSQTRIEVSAQANQSVILRVNGSDRITVTGLSGATTGNQDVLRAGIDHYDTSTLAETVRLYHAAVAWSQAGWLGAP